MYFLFPFTVAVVIEIIFIRSENPRNEHVICLRRYADVIRLVCEHIFTNFVNYTLLLSKLCFTWNLHEERTLLTWISLKKRAETMVICLMRISKYGWQAIATNNPSKISISFVSYTMSRDVHCFGSHCYPWHKPIISIFRKFLRKAIESSFKCKFFFLASCARAYETWKQCQWIMKTLTCKLKSGGKITSFLGPI